MSGWMARPLASLRRFSREPLGSVILKSVHEPYRRDPASPPPRALGERLAAARRSGDADRHGPARRRRPGGARGGPAPGGPPRRGHRAAARHPSPSRPRRPRGHDPAALGGRRGRARPDGRLRGALRRRGGRGPAVRALVDGPPRRAGAARRRDGVVLAVHPGHDRGLPRRRAAGRRRRSAGRRAPPAGGGAPRSQHHRHAVRRRPGCRRVRRRPPAGDDLVQHGDLPARPCARRSRPLAPALPGGPRAHAIDAAHPPPDRPRRAGHRARPARGGAPARPSPALRAHPRRTRRRPRHGLRDRRPPVARADGDRAAAARRLGGGRQPRAAPRGRRCRRAHRRRRLGVRSSPPRVARPNPRARCAGGRAGAPSPDCAGRR